MGIVFLWFGALKFFPGLSPATDLAVRTISVLTFGLIPGNISLILLAALEIAIGVGFLAGRYMRLALGLLVFQMAGTLTPLALFSGEAFIIFPCPDSGGPVHHQEPGAGRRRPGHRLNRARRADRR